MQIQDHILKGDNVSLQESPNRSEKFKPGLPDTLIIHYTAGRDAKSSANHLCNPSARASAHLVVGRAGEIIQLVPFDTVAWHAGPSSYNGRSGFNRLSIGIEIDNAGVLTPSGDSFKSWFGADYPANQVIKAIHRNETTPKYWHTYPENQIQLVFDICQLLKDKYDI